ncbi:DAZ-associated protein 2-like isoform X2 [Xenia sp. Carnegie-2017]|uniref:DAZ-associated protein 2-like isoform X2 n=1 Tax=Xenia sp. Carnegie-2017 TaxID=2897299 RepID=UPI001F03D3CE|nr:DAZ-associated protein 2-like isoform X2 [Xenia sp. Carnegie-2017]
MLLWNESFCALIPLRIDMSGKKNFGYPVQGSGNQRPAYPTQATASYPIQPSSAYPMQATANYPMQPTAGYPGQVYQQSGYGHHQHNLYTAPQVPHSHPGYGQPPPPYPGVVPNAAPMQPMMQGQFDSGARFGAGASVSIPPPPPGVMPTSAQMASYNGQPVVMQQHKTGWLEGAQGGGYTFW